MRPSVLALSIPLTVWFVLAGCGYRPVAEPSPASDPDVVPPLHQSVDDYGEALLEIDGTELAVLVADQARQVWMPQSKRLRFIAMRQRSFPATS